MRHSIQEHRSLHLPAVTAGNYNIKFKAAGYDDEEFTITVAHRGETTFAYNLEPIPQGVIWLQSPETVIPSEVYLEDPVDFSFYISNTGDLDVEYAIRVEFESTDLPEPITILFPSSDSELKWSKDIPAGAYIVNYATVTLPSEAIPIDRDEATFDVSVHLLAR
jgi:hypothetical protein